MWIVLLSPDSPSVSHVFRHNYFPRLFRYKKDAVACKREVEIYGGKAIVEKKK